MSKISPMNFDPGKSRERAQELMWTAMDCEDDKQAAALCRQALAIYPDCVDAISMLADLESRVVRDYIAAMREAVAAGRRDLGPKFFKEWKGMFWGMMESRPLMRAMAGLAEALAGTTAPASVDEAIAIEEEMLSLNPNDNQGIRGPLVGHYLERKRYGDAENLLEKYKGDGMAVSLWARVLLAFLDDDEAKTLAAVKIARKQNKYVWEYLSGHTRRPRGMPDFYSPGDEAEAVICTDILWRAWRSHAKALRWLKGLPKR